jgi:hypothetical protein
MPIVRADHCAERSSYPTMPIVALLPRPPLLHRALPAAQGEGTPSGKVCAQLLRGLEDTFHLRVLRAW